MQLTQSIKRAPKWAWFTVAGVGLGAIGIKVWKDRATDATPSTDGTEVGTPTYGSPGVSGSPTPVITPPVIIGGDSGDGGSIAAYLAIIGQNFDTLVTGITGLAAGDQGLASEGINTVGDIATSVIAGAGSAPAPVVQNPTPVIINVPAPSAPSHSIPAPSKPCCTYSGHPLSWWRNPSNAKNKDGWKWPGSNDRHSRPFEGNRSCDGGGVAGGSKKDC